MTEAESGPAPQQETVGREPSLQTGEGCFEVHYDYSRAKHYSMPGLINAFFHSFTMPQNQIPVITSVSMRGPEQVEIRRRILHKNFHNSAQDMPEEVFIVSRQAME